MSAVILDRETAPAMERLCREEAWLKFTAEIGLSLNVWQIDADVRREVPHPLDWLRKCRDDLDGIIQASGALW
jgi:hypothetical protein